MKRLVSLFGCLLVAACAVLPDTAHARKPKFRITTKNTEMKKIGFSVRMLYRGEERTLSPAPVYTYKDMKGGRMWDMFDPRDLWYRNQLICQWQDRDGNSCVLAEITASLPRGFRRKHVMKDEYEAAFHRQEDAGDWDLESMNKWVEDFVGQKPSGPPEELRHKANIKQLVEFRFVGPTLAYAFYLPESLHFKTKEKWFCVLFRLNPAIDKEKARQEVLSQFIASLRPVVVRETEDTGHSKRLQDKKFSPGGKRSENFLMSRKRVVSSIKNTENWWYVETRNYIIVSNVGPSKRRLVKRLQSDIEYLRAAYEQFMLAPNPIEAVSVVRVFAGGKEYVDYVGPKLEWSGGVWMPQRMELVIKPVERGGSGSGSMSAVLSVMYHEAFHQYVFYAFGRVEPAVWFNEGHAVFFENARITENRLRVGEHDRRAMELREMIRAGAPNIERMLHMSYEDFYVRGGNDRQRSRNYSLAWGIVYFLRKGVLTLKENPYADVLYRYWNALDETKDGDRATTIAFDGIDLDRFKEDFMKFWKSSSRRGKAKRTRIFRDFRGWQGGAGGKR